MTDKYIPDNAPRDILLSLQELSQKNIPHAATFKLAAARIAELEEQVDAWKMDGGHAAARIAELEAALLPFAAIADESTANLADNYMYPDCYPMSAFRAARAAYLGEKE